MDKVVAVRYRLFEGEDDAVELAAANQAHDFGGEVALTLEGGRELFISWVSEPVQHSVGTGDASFFRGDAALIDYDVSSSPFWTNLIGWSGP